MLPPRILLSGLAALALLAAAHPAHAQPWTLERAVATALESSPDARLARARIEGAQALVGEARAAAFPQVRLQGGYTGTDNPMHAFGAILNQRAFHPGLDFNRPGTIDNLNATGSVAYTLYNGGRTAAGQTAARAGAQAAAHDLQAAQQQLATEVVKAALNLQKSREAIDAVAAGVRAYEAAVNTARLRFDAGQLLKADLLSLEVQLAQTREALASTRHGAALAEHAFRFVLGLEPTPDPSDPAPIELANLDPTLQALAAPESRDFSQRPELLSLAERVRAAEAAVARARGARRPSVNAFASYQYDHGYKLDHGGESWLAGLSVDLNVFDGGQITAKIRASQAELTQAREQLRKATLGIGLEVERARLAHADAVERLAVTARAVAHAEESATLSRARFEREALLSADLIGVESRLIEARLRRMIATTDERVALVELRRALGINPLP